MHITFILHQYHFMIFEILDPSLHNHHVYFWLSFCCKRIGICVWILQHLCNNACHYHPFKVGISVFTHITILLSEMLEKCLWPSIIYTDSQRFFYYHPFSTTVWPEWNLLYLLSDHTIFLAKKHKQPSYSKVSTDTNVGVLSLSLHL